MLQGNSEEEKFRKKMNSIAPIHLKIYMFIDRVWLQTQCKYRVKSKVPYKTFAPKTATQFLCANSGFSLELSISLEVRVGTLKV